MRPYTFELQTLLELRRNSRVERQRQLAEALHAEEVLRQQISELQRELMEQQSHLRIVGQQTDLDVNKLLDVQRYELVLRSQVGGLKEKLEKVQEETERRRLALVAADGSVRSLERIDDKRRGEHRQRANRKQQVELDDLSSGTFARANVFNR